MRLSRQFLVPSRSRMIKPVGQGQKPMGLKRAVMPLGVKRQVLAEKMGISGRGGVLLLSEGLGSADKNAVSGGRGFGVKSPNPAVLQKLERLQIGKPRKNVSISF
jgi:hypothetical protein